MTLAWARSPHITIRAKYEISSEEFSPRGGQILLSRSKVGVLFYPYHRACYLLPSLPSYKRVHRQSANHSLSPATPNVCGGAILSLWVQETEQLQQVCEASLACGKEVRPKPQPQVPAAPLLLGPMLFQEALRVCPD